MPPAHDNTTPFYEYMTHFLESEDILIRGVVKTSDNKTYLLSDNEDYEFSGIDARLLTTVVPTRIHDKTFKIQ